MDYKRFKDNSNCWGFQDFLEKSQLKEKNKRVKKPLLEKNKCVVGAFIQVYERVKGKKNSKYVYYKSLK